MSVLIVLHGIGYCLLFFYILLSGFLDLDRSKKLLVKRSLFIAVIGFGGLWLTYSPQSPLNKESSLSSSSSSSSSKKAQKPYECFQNCDDAISYCSDTPKACHQARDSCKRSCCSQHRYYARQNPNMCR